MPTRTEAIKSFLSQKTHNDLFVLYDYSMECQVNVAQDGGERVEGDYFGKKWTGYTDGSQTWKSFRIPRNAMTNPEYVDTQLTFDLGAHVEAIGMTGWNWEKKISKYVAFDFDSILGHSEKHTSKLSNDELSKIQHLACEIPWVTVRKSTGGNGLHLYVFVDDIPTNNHIEHSALARATLSKMSGLTGFNFEGKVDTCGGNIWIWHRKMLKAKDGLILIKQGDILRDIPENWRFHLDVIRGTRKKILTPLNNQGVPDIEQKFDSLSAQRHRIKLDDQHLQLIKYLTENNLHHWWDVDHHMLVTHTLHLKKAYDELSLKGIFETESTGSTSHNCYAYPLRNGGWVIRRYSPGVKEAKTWDIDNSGWTRCFFNVDPTLKSASISFGGLEDPSGGFRFSKTEDAERVALALGANIKIPSKVSGRSTCLKPHKDGRLIIEFEHTQFDHPNDFEGWLQKGSKWVRMFGIQKTNPSEIDVENYDDIVRHIITEQGSNAGWVVNVEGKWIDEPLQHIKPVLESLNLKPNEVKAIIGGNVLKPWVVKAVPFQSEYPGDRVWNRHAPQFRFPASIEENLNYPTWKLILEHVGKNLNVSENKWCKDAGILTGGDYLEAWIACMIKYPFEPLPYLFLYSEEQNSGKSTLHEALSLLFNPGYQFVDHAIINTNSFNAELEGMILCVIEETDLSNTKTKAYERIKQWVTSPKISIHRKHITPYLIDNTAHFIQCSNTKRSCPVLPGDTRIVMIHVEPPKEEIPKRILMKQLEKEGPDFLSNILNKTIIDSNTRLRLPVIDTKDKLQAQASNSSALQLFLQENCHFIPGRYITLAEFFDRFQQWLEPHERVNWSKRKMSDYMPDKILKGRIDNCWCWGNISFEPGHSDYEFVVIGEALKLSPIKKEI